MPAGKTPENPLPGNGLWGWLGRQVGHVKTAVKQDPTKPGPKAIGAAAGAPVGVKPQPAQPPSAAGVLYRADQVQELPHPTNPQLKLRRTVIDEVIVDKKKES